ncbi:hypothetical protein FMUAM8_51590 [Nocardia cyriacigeorgica]|nr:hypothetical protein FMUAM8_51590 [Nocardia cyriacigeorgica]
MGPYRLADTCQASLLPHRHPADKGQAVGRRSRRPVGKHPPAGSLRNYRAGIDQPMNRSTPANTGRVAAECLRNQARHGQAAGRFPRNPTGWAWAVNHSLHIPAVAKFLRNQVARGRAAGRFRHRPVDTFPAALFLRLHFRGRGTDSARSLGVRCPPEARRLARGGGLG